MHFIKNTVVVFVLIMGSYTTYSQELLPDATLRNKPQDASGLKVEAQKKLDEKQRAVFVNAVRSTQPLELELKSPDNRELMVINDPAIIHRYTTDPAIKEIILIERKNNKPAGQMPE